MTARRARPGRLRASLAVIAVYLALTAAMTWPLAARLSSHLGAPEGPGDPYLNVWILGWDLRTIVERPGALLDGRVFDANIFHPAAGTLAYSDHLLPQALMVLPVYLATGDVVVCYNVLLFLSFFLSGLAMHACARQLGAPVAGAFVAGIAWAFWPYRFSHLIHLQLQSLYLLPLAVLFLARYLAGARLRDALLLGLVAGLQAASSFYYGVATGLALVTIGAVAGVLVGRWRQPKYLAGLAVAAIVGTLVVAPVAWPYWRMQRQEGFGRTVDEAGRHAAVPASYLQVPEVNAVYGRTRLLTARDTSGDLRPGRLEGVEQGLFPGFALFVLAALGVWRTRLAATRPFTIALLALALLGFLLSLGPEGWRALYAAFHRYAIGFQAIRAPARFGVLVAFGCALLAARGASSVRGVWRVALPLVLLVEYASAPLPLVPRPPRRTPTGEWLARAEGPGAVLYLPLTNDRRNTVAMVDSLQHGRPVVNGYSGQRPSFFPALVDVFATFPDTQALLTLKELGVRFVVAADDTALTDDGAASPLVERARVPGSVIYEVVWTPASEAALTPAPVAPAPAPGPPAFGIGERAVYDVIWEGGPLDIAAGTATLEVAPAETPGASYRFIASARTADWVTPFFEARDEYITAADQEFLPLRHERFQRHGRREVARKYEFDAAAGRVTLQTPGGDPLTLRMPPGTRDALTAFYYLRTLAPDRRGGLTLPVNDGGRTRMIDVTMRGTETVRVQGTERTATRLDAVVREQVPRRAPVTVSIWLSDDGRRIPIAAAIEAGFGSVRIELREYRP